MILFINSLTKNPDRWTDDTRDWSIENQVFNNPEKMSSTDRHMEEKDAS